MTPPTLMGPTVRGRKLPRLRSERDDHTPLAGGRWVTCRDNSTVMNLAYATNGHVDIDAPVFRAEIVPADPDGITVEQAAGAVLKLAHLPLVYPGQPGWPGTFNLARTRAWLLAAKGLIVDGWYDELPPRDREQPGSDTFTHSIFASHASASTGNVYVYDPLVILGPAEPYGRWIRGADFYTFAASLNYEVSFIPLQPL